MWLWLNVTLSASPLVGSTAEDELEAASPCLVLILGPGEWAGSGGADGSGCLITGRAHPTGVWTQNHSGLQSTQSEILKPVWWSENRCDVTAFLVKVWTLAVRTTGVCAPPSERTPLTLVQIEVFFQNYTICTFCLCRKTIRWLFLSCTHPPKIIFNLFLFMLSVQPLVLPEEASLWRSPLVSLYSDMVWPDGSLLVKAFKLCKCQNRTCD